MNGVRCAVVDYPALAARVIAAFTAGTIPFQVIEAATKAAYAGFDHKAIVPLIQLDSALFVQELFHGPTLAFKDMAMQVLGRLFDHVLAARDERITIVGATSGDTGSAAIAAFAGLERVRIAMLHPLGRVSDVQRRQMTTVLAPNVANIAVEGTFDDCQDLVKAMFADAPFRRAMRLSAVNSINWARVAAQVPYYVAAALALGAPDRPVSFSVPSGNFGNVLAGWVARRMGLPIQRLIVAANSNDILARFFQSNDMSVRTVMPTLSPSMDIQVSSNFERLLFELLDRDRRATAATMRGFRETGRMDVPNAAWAQAQTVFQGFSLDDAGTAAEIAFWHGACGYVADPHTAIGLAASRALGKSDIADHSAGDGPSGEVPRCGRARDRQAPVSAGSSRGPVFARGAVHHRPQRSPRGGRAGAPAKSKELTMPSGREPQSANGSTTVKSLRLTQYSGNASAKFISCYDLEDSKTLN